MATRDDAAGLAGVLTALRQAGLRRKPGDAGFALAHYLAHADRVACTLAEDAEGGILGFQSLKRAWPGNPYGVTPGWGIIGTHVVPAAARRGVGRALFALTSEEARRAGLLSIDATIGEANAPALAYYDAMGFRIYRRTPGAICMRFDTGG